MPTDPILKLENQLCFALYAASNAMIRRYREPLNAFGLTYPQYLTMLVLWESAPLSVKEIGERLSLDSGTLTPMLKRMQAAGLVTRQRNEADERQVDIDLTDQGRALRRKAAAMAEALACSLPLTPRDITRLREELKRFGAALQAAEAAPPAITSPKRNSSA